MKWILGLCIFLPLHACGKAQTTGAPLNLNLPAQGSANWGDKVNQNFTTINTFASTAATFPNSNGIVYRTGPGTSRIANYADIVGLWSGCSTGYLMYNGSCGNPSGGVASVFGRTGAVTAQSGDYSFSLISGMVSAGQLPLFGSAAAGAVPASGGGTTNFLRADGTWAVPPGGGGGGGSFPQTVSGTTTSGGVTYFSNATTLSSSGALAANAVVLGGGAGGAPFTATGITSDGISILSLGNGSVAGGITLYNGVSSGRILLDASGSGSQTWHFPTSQSTDTVVGTEATQTLTNKTVDGVTPATFAFLDPTSSVQTQLNAKAPLASPVFTGTITLPITGSTQCLHVNSSGAISGTGSDCGSGGGGGTNPTASGVQYWDNSGLSWSAVSGFSVTGGNLTGITVSGSDGGVFASGIIDGLTATTTTTTAAVAVGTTSGPCSPTACFGGYFYNNDNAEAVTYTLPDAQAGMAFCFENAVGVTTAMTIQTSGAGQFVAYQGANSSSGGSISMGGALGDSLCVKGQSSTQWYAVVQSGNPTLN